MPASRTVSPRRSTSRIALLAIPVALVSCSDDDAIHVAGTVAPATIATVPATVLSGSSSSPSPSADTTAPTQPETTPGVTTPGVTTPPLVPTTEATAPPTTEAPQPTTPTLDQITVRLEDFGTFDQPIVMASHRDGAILVGERKGKVKRATDGAVLLDISGDTTTDSERGLLGLAIAPDGDKVYVSYTNDDGDTRIDEYRLDGDSLVDRRNVIGIDQPYGNHNGGNIVFGPDGMLYIGMGDGGSGGDPERRGLNGKVLLGKMLRIDPSTPSGDLGYTIPADNPFVGTKTRGEIWSVGLRNPWRFSFDRATGDLWIGDVGQGEWEEIDHVRNVGAGGPGRGLSFGWSAYEGTHRFNDDVSEPNHTPPIHEYPHGDGNASVNGGYVYRGTAIPALTGAYVYSDYSSGRIWAMEFDPRTGAFVREVEIAKLDGIVSFGEGPDGELYAIGLGEGVKRIVPA